MNFVLKTKINRWARLQILIKTYQAPRGNCLCSTTTRVDWGFSLHLHSFRRVFNCFSQLYEVLDLKSHRFYNFYLNLNY